MPTQLRLGLRENRTTFSPGDEIAGAVDWECDTAPACAQVRLCWRTVGKGTPDLEVVGGVEFDNLAATDLRTFSFTAPDAPYSFSGKLISLVWVVELVLQPGDEAEQVEVVIAPHGREVTLGTAPSIGRQGGVG